jgi:hypothetical protein
MVEFSDEALDALAPFVAMTGSRRIELSRWRRKSSPGAISSEPNHMASIKAANTGRSKLLSSPL